MLSLQVKLTQDQGQHQQEHWHLLKGTSHSALGPQRNARAGAGDKGQTKACTQHQAEPSAIRLTTAYAAHKLTRVNICTTLCCSLSTVHLLPATTYHYGPQVHLHPVSACLAGTRQFFIKEIKDFWMREGVIYFSSSLRLLTPYRCHYRVRLLQVQLLLYMQGGEYGFALANQQYNILIYLELYSCVRQKNPSLFTESSLRVTIKNSK